MQRQNPVVPWCRYADDGVVQETALDLATKGGHKQIVDLLNPHPYPSFLSYLKVKPKQLTAETVAHALWLTDKGVKPTNASKTAFELWAKKQNLLFNQDDVERCLASSYVMTSR